MLFTDNSLYVLRHGVCVAVVDRRSRTSLPRHPVVGKRLLCGVYRDYEGRIAARQNDVAPGDRCYFSNKVLTTPVERVR
jgi:hypothetical protein